MYKLLNSALGDSIKNLETAEVFPIVPGNADYEEYLAWLALGNEPEAAEAAQAPSGNVVAQTNARAWYLSTPNAALLFELSIDGLVAEIDSLDLTALPATTRAKLKLLLKTLSVAVRVLAKQQGLT